MPGSRITLKDIAQITGYSVNTVSRAIRGDSRLPERTRSIIQNAADTHGYIKNNLASSLRSGSSHLIAVIINDITNQHYSYVVSEIETCLRTAGYDILILCTPPVGEEDQSGSRIIRIAIRQSVDGILYFPYQHDQASVTLMHRSGIPFVLVDRWIENVNADIVRCDDYLGGKLAAEHFLSLGHSRYLYVQGPVNSSSQTDRQQGFIDTLLSRGVQKQNIHIVSNDTLLETVNQGTLASMIRSLQATAALVFRDELAYLMVNHLSERNILVPRDLSVIGFDHIRGFFPYQQPLTSIFCPQEYSLGQTAVRMLLNRIANPTAPVQDIIFPVRLYEEGTTRSFVL